VRVSWRVRGKGEPTGSPSPIVGTYVRWVLAVCVLWVLLAAVYVDEGHADPGPECASALDGPSCMALATRLDSALVELAAIRAELEAEPAPVSGTVALSEGDAARLDLVWIGVFMVGGLMFGLVVGSWIKREQTAWGSRV
jgi:hypothetical protein